MKVWIVYDSDFYNDNQGEPMIFESKEEAINWAVK